MSCFSNIIFTGVIIYVIVILLFSSAEDSVEFREDTTEKAVENILWPEGCAKVK